MVNTNKTLSLLLAVILTVSSLIIVEFASAQSIPKPSVPEFTLNYVDNSYDVPPTTTSTTDPYTGKTITTTTHGYRVEKKSIEITVNNQPFTPYTDAEGHTINLSYDVRYKGHFSESGWIQPFYQPIRNGEYGFTAQHPQSNSGYTVISVPSEFRVGDVVDFQVQKLEGYYTSWEPMLAIVMGTSQFTGQFSEWSNTQTVTIDQNPTSNSTPSPTQTPTNTIFTIPTLALNSPTPTVPEFPSWIIMLLLTITLGSAGLLVCHKKLPSRKKA
jgi:hypothetical protein